MFCQKCGNQMEEGSKFYPKCGSQTASAQTVVVDNMGGGNFKSF